MPSDPDEPEPPDEDMALVDRVWLQFAEDISREFPGVAVYHGVQGFWALDGERRVGPVSCPLALRAMLGTPRPRSATP